MSYLDTPRIHFFGKCFAYPSTINNTMRNYDLKPDAVPYPAMTERLDLADYQAASSSSTEVLEVISLPIRDPTHMAVTRDLSASRRTLIQTWIENGCLQGERDG